ncbi:MAG: recombinase-like helix-turn-helix domain-containing protein [Alphaproteobacteria bacterium]
MIDYNPFLRERRDGPELTKGDADSIETYNPPRLTEWQTRPAPPAADENALGDALEAMFSEEVYELARIVARLNDRGPRAADGNPWTEASFMAEMKRLAGEEI